MKELTSGQAAKELGVAINTLCRWADAGMVPVKRLPSGHRRFTEAQMAAIKRQLGHDDLVGNPNWANRTEPVTEPESALNKRLREKGLL